MANSDKYICPGKDECKSKTCMHCKPHTHDPHCRGSNCETMHQFRAGQSFDELKELKSLVCEKIEGGKKK